MQEIINSINEAEAKAAEIKAAALQKAAEITAAAEVRADEVARKCETECKLYRENQLKKAERDAQAKASADSVIKKTDGAVKDIVRRITRGSC